MTPSLPPLPVAPNPPDQSITGPLEESRPTIKELVPYFLAYLAHESRVSKSTLKTYGTCLRRIVRVVGDMRPEELMIQNVLAIKSSMAQDSVGPAFVRLVSTTLKTFLRFCKLILNLEVLDPKLVKVPRLPRREVIFFTPAEIEQFVSAIPIFSTKRRMDLKWLGFRCLIEVLLGTAMRISEALSLTRSSVNYETGEARIIGKGNKERTAFFSPRALGWIKEYLSRRKDNKEQLFINPDGRPFNVSTVEMWCRLIRDRAGLQKRVTPHIFRHTVATTLLFNGCPISHVKEILGHDRLETTCQYYLGIDKKAAKDAHRKYLTF